MTKEDERLKNIGEQIREIRLNADMSQETLCLKAGISLATLKNLERGKGSTIRVLIMVLNGLGYEDWLSSLSFVSDFNPVTMTRRSNPRQRAAKQKQSILVEGEENGIQNRR